MNPLVSGALLSITLSPLVIHVFILEEIDTKEVIVWLTKHSWNKKEYQGSFQWKITGLQYLAYLSGKKSEEAELNGKERTKGKHTLQNLCLSQ